MGGVARNILANLSGNIWTALLGFLCVPVYLHYIGTEGYGLIGFFGSVTAILAVFDAGMSAAAGRELARFTAAEPTDVEGRQKTLDLVVSLEVVFWAMACLQGLILVALAPWFVEHWLTLKDLSADSALQALRLMGLAFLVQWPLVLYNGCLIGTQRQVRQNAVAVSIATLRSLGAVAVLALLSPTVEAFFAWQLGVSVVGTAATRWTLWLSLPRGFRNPRFCREQLRSISGFAAGVAGVDVTWMMLMQADKVILSKVLTLSAFGRYSLAWTLASYLWKLTYPVWNAVYPRMVQLLAGGEEKALIRVFHRGCATMAAVLVPGALMLAVWGRLAVGVWTHNPGLAHELWPILTCLSLGVMANGLIHIPYSLQLAHGSTRIGVVNNLVAFAVMAPLIYLAAVRHGALAGSLVWMAVHVSYLLTMALVMGAYLPGQYLSWLRRAVLVPVALAGGLDLLAAGWLPTAVGPLAQILCLVGVFGVSQLAVVLAMRSEMSDLGEGLYQEENSPGSEDDVACSS